MAMVQKQSLKVAATVLALLLPGVARADVVTEWNAKTVAAAKTAGLGPNPSTRALALVHIAIHDALVAISKKYEPYHATLPVTLPASKEVAAATAAHDVLVALFPAQKAALDEAWTTATPNFTGAAKTNGTTLGQAAAADILALRANDGSAATTDDYVVGATPAVGIWRPTPPANKDPNEPWWRKVKPFALTAANAARPAAPPTVTSEAYTKDFKEVASLGDKTSTTRTAEQSTVAVFWNFATHIPFSAVARQVSAARGLDIDQNARLFALLSIALADSRIAAWDAKYFHSCWRPITSIPLANATDSTKPDYNANTPANPSFVSYIETPNHPSYPSGHSTTSAAAVGILKRWFGDEVAFTVTSDNLPEVTRSFASFTQSTLENGRSRIYGGIHFQFDNTAGQALGEAVAAATWSTLLKPVAVAAPSDAGANDGGIADAGAPAPSSGDAGAKVNDAGGGDASVTPPLLDDDGDDGCSYSTHGEHGVWWILGVAGVAVIAASRRRKRNPRS